MINMRLLRNVKLHMRNVTKFGKAIDNILSNEYITEIDKDRLLTKADAMLHILGHDTMDSTIAFLDKVNDSANKFKEDFDINKYLKSTLIKYNDDIVD